MGNNLNNLTAEEKAYNEEKAINNQINKSLERTKPKPMIKILLLGTSGCGKSTVLKQMKILLKDGFSKSEKKDFINLIRSNCFDSLRLLINSAIIMEYPFSNDEATKSAQFILSLNKKFYEQKEFTEEEYNNLVFISKEPCLEQCLARSNEIPFLIESAEYFIKKTSEIFSPDYSPEISDILHSRLTTNGIVETTFNYRDTPFVIYDVGGQRGQRKKWLACFEDVTAILFVASLSEYDEVLAEDSKCNRLYESLNVFYSICRLPWCQDIPIVLFLNKKDIFEKKYHTRQNFSKFLPHFSGVSIIDAQKSISDLYFDKALKANYHKEIYSHFTNATDTGNIEVVWTSINEIIIRKFIGFTVD